MIARSLKQYGEINRARCEEEKKEVQDSLYYNKFHCRGRNLFIFSRHVSFPSEQSYHFHLDISSIPGYLEKINRSNEIS